MITATVGSEREDTVQLVDVEEFHSIAPSGVIEKQRKNFEELWRHTRRQLRLPA